MRRMAMLGLLAAMGVLPAQAAGPAVIVLLGTGVQIYGCTQTATGFAWRLKGPDAILTDTAGRRAGQHFAGPSWQAEDGSTVTGEVLVASEATQADAVPWLVLKAKTHGGEGLFSTVAYVVRSATVGGAAPATGCDPAHGGAETRVNYSATYTFFSG